jgi:hypothetical protein
VVWDAVEAGDLEGAAEEILAWYPIVQTDDLENDTGKRATARNFISACLRFLDRPDSIGHRRETAVQDVMKDVARRADDVLTADHKEGFKRVNRRRAVATETDRITEENRAQLTTGRTDPGLSRTVRGGTARRLLSWDVRRGVRARFRRAESALGAARTGAAAERLAVAVNELAEILSEPALRRAAYVRAAIALADAALIVHDTHDDPAALLDAAVRLERNARVGVAVPSLLHLLRARASLALVRDGSADHRLPSCCRGNRVAAGGGGRRSVEAASAPRNPRHGRSTHRVPRLGCPRPGDQGMSHRPALRPASVAQNDTC